MPYKDKNAQKSYQNKWMTARRMAWILSQGGKCVECGATDNLEVDHINPKNKTVNPRRLWSLAEDNPTRIKELENCQVLCSSCHRVKTNSELMKSYEHGELGMYKNRKCRCELCKAANADRVRKERLARKQKLDNL